jgi:hypothetical protein
MRYLKTNESLFTAKSEKIFDKLIQNFENKLTEDGFEFERKKNDLWLGRIPKNILKRIDYLIVEKDVVKDVDSSSMEYELTIALIKESTFDKPFVQARCKGSLSLGDLISSENVGLMDMIKSRSFSENPITIFGLIEPCKKQAISRYKSGNKKSDFYKSYPIDDIKDRLYDLSDELGISFEISKIEGGTGYDVEFETSIRFENREHQGGHYVTGNMDDYSKLIIELNNLYKSFDSMGLTLYFDPYSIFNNVKCVYLQIIEKKDGE